MAKSKHVYIIKYVTNSVKFDECLCYVLVSANSSRNRCIIAGI